MPHLRVMDNCVLESATLCLSEHRIVCGLSLYPNSHVHHSIELLPLRNLFRLLDCLDDCCLALSHNRDVVVPFSVLDLWELHGSSFCTSESPASVV